MRFFFNEIIENAKMYFRVVGLLWVCFGLYIDVLSVSIRFSVVFLNRLKNKFMFF